MPQGSEPHRPLLQPVERAHESAWEVAAAERPQLVCLKRPVQWSPEREVPLASVAVEAAVRLQA